MAQRIYFIRCTLGFPVLSTLYGTLDMAFLTSLPAIFTKLVRKYSPPSTAMVQEYLYHTRRNTGSIISIPLTPQPTQPASAIRPGVRTHNVFASCIPSTGSIFIDQAGCFPVWSMAGNTDLLVIYDFDSTLSLCEYSWSRSRI